MAKAYYLSITHEKHGIQLYNVTLNLADLTRPESPQLTFGYGPVLHVVPRLPFPPFPVIGYPLTGIKCPQK